MGLLILGPEFKPPIRCRGYLNKKINLKKDQSSYVYLSHSSNCLSLQLSFSIATSNSQANFWILGAATLFTGLTSNFRCLLWEETVKGVICWKDWQSLPQHYHSVFLSAMPSSVLFWFLQSFVNLSQVLHQ